MSLLTILGGIFSSAKIYLLVGVAFVAVCGLAYIEHLYARAYKAEATLSSAEATINESKAVIDQDMAAIAELKKINIANQAALRAAALTAENLVYEYAAIKDAINAIPEPKTCQALDARDRAVLDSLRRRLKPTPADPNASH